MKRPFTTIHLINSDFQIKWNDYTQNLIVPHDGSEIELLAVCHHARTTDTTLASKVEQLIGNPSVELIQALVKLELGYREVLILEAKALNAKKVVPAANLPTNVLQILPKRSKLTLVVNTTTH